MYRTLLIAGFLFSGFSSITPVSAQELSDSLSSKDYTFGYWKNGVRKHKGDKSADILAIETGRYGLELNMAQLDKAKFGIINDDQDYERALMSQSKRLNTLKDIPLNIQIEKDGKLYKATSGLAAEERANGDRFQGTMMWESARIMQHYEIMGLDFEAADGEKLSTESSLKVVGWPDSFSFTAEIAPLREYQNGATKGIVGKAFSVVDEPLIIKHEKGMENEQFTVECWIYVPEPLYRKKGGWILSKTKNEANDGNFGFVLTNGAVRGVMNIGGREKENRHYATTQSKTITPDEWHHLAMTYDGDMMMLYVDGKQLAEKKIGKKRNLASGDLSIGKRADGNGEVVPVVMDQLRIWDRALTNNELNRHKRKPAELKNRSGLTYENNFETKNPIADASWENAKIIISMGEKKHGRHVEKKISGKWNERESKKSTLKIDLTNSKQAKKEKEATKITVSMAKNDLPPVEYVDEWNAYVANVVKPKRPWDKSDRSSRNYDEIDLTVTSNKVGNVPFMLDFRGPASITGLCPVLCDENGVPTGVPVQLSKNWHYPKLGSYLRSSILLPTVKGTQKYKLRIIYGYYGTLPSASHSQLSLVGYGGNGRWDQLAIGTWGETYCMDMEMSLVDVAVTDIRMLMARDGAKGEMWNWTDAGWGGDWLGLNDSRGNKLYFKGMKAAYQSHGPCLTEAIYTSDYGAKSEASVRSVVRTLRTNDYARTFTDVKYVFNKEVKAEGWLFKMGRTHKLITPQFSYGNKAGLIKEVQVPESVKPGDDVIPKTELTGQAPYWVSFSKALVDDGRNWGKGYRAMVIRSYKVTSRGKTYTKPTVEFPVYRKTEGGANVDFLLSAPAAVKSFKPGDTVELEIEWITLPNHADDYYGGNEAFRKHVAENPASWKTTYREAVGNDLKVKVKGGKLKQSYPIIIEADSAEVTVDITGGVGYVPIRFDGLKSSQESLKNYAIYQLVDGKEVKLDQSTHGNDFWQTDYDAKSDTYKITYNLPLDGLKTSQWIFRK